MQTECTRDFFSFEPVEGRSVVAAFDGGAVSSDAGALLLGQTDCFLVRQYCVPLRSSRIGGVTSAITAPQSSQPYAARNESHSAR